MANKIKPKIKSAPKKTISRLRAFSLVELSVVILIMSILVTGALTASKTSIRNANYKLTRERMDAINKALTSFVGANKRLPCPGSFGPVSGDGNYGTEGTTPGTCTGATQSSTYTDLVWGMVPVVALGLPSEMAADGFGTRFSYVVDKRFTLATVNTSSTTGFEYTPGSPQGAVKVSPPSATPTTVANQTYAIMTTGATGGNIINVRDSSTVGTMINSIALYVLVSHGANKLGGYNFNSGTPNSTSGAGAGETANYFTAAFDNVFVSNATDVTSDDLILFRNKLQLIYDAGLEYIICSNRESYYCATPAAQLTTATTCNSGTATAMSWATATYGAPAANTITGACAGPGGASTAGTCDDRQCGRYGLWSTPTSTS